MRNRKGERKFAAIYLTGGLGNQLFQYAAILNYVSESRSSYCIDVQSGVTRVNSNGRPEIFSYDLATLPTLNYADRWKKLTRKILGLNLRLGLVSDPSVSRKIAFFSINKLSNLWGFLVFHRYYDIWVSPNLGFSKIPMSTNSRYLIGYFQSFRYLEAPGIMFAMQSLKLATISSEVQKYQELSQSEKPLVVHVRLQDYRNEENFGVLSTSYYERSIQAQMDTSLYKKIWIFSDDIEGAKELIPQQFHSDIRWIYEIDGSVASTLEVMRLGFGYVIGNSTFSWWAAVLSHNSNGMVIAPTPWFTGIDEPHALVPKSWIRFPR